VNPKLVIKTEDENQDVFEISPDQPYFLGRDTKSDIVIHEKKASRQHARIVYLPSEQKLFIEDLNSLNGTRVNEERIKGTYELRHQDVIRIGSVQITVVWEASGTAQVTPARISGFARTTDLSKPQEAELVYDYFSEDEESQLRKTDGRMISGKIEDLPLSDILQMLATTRKNGELLVSPTRIGAKRNPDQASIYLKDGQVLHVRYAGKMNEPAFFNLLRLKKGFFALFPFPKDESQLSPVMETPLEALLLEGLRILDEEDAQSKLTPNDILEPNPDEPLTGLKPDELRIFQLAWRLQQVDKILAQSPFGAGETEQILLKLLRNGFLKRL
jgi:hypothetical protein